MPSTALSQRHAPRTERAFARLFGHLPPGSGCGVVREGGAVIFRLTSGHSFTVTPRSDASRSGSVTTDAFEMLQAPGWGQAVNGVQTMLLNMVDAGVDVDAWPVCTALERTMRHLVLDYEDGEPEALAATALCAGLAPFDTTGIPDETERPATITIDFAAVVGEGITTYTAPSGEDVGFQLPDGRILRPWLTFEVSADANEDRYERPTPTYEQLCAMGVVLTMPDRIEVEIAERDEDAGRA